jgi:hypothetical protein
VAVLHTEFAIVLRNAFSSSDDAWLQRAVAFNCPAVWGARFGARRRSAALPCPLPGASAFALGALVAELYMNSGML